MGRRPRAGLQGRQPPAFAAPPGGGGGGALPRAGRAPLSAESSGPPAPVGQGATPAGAAFCLWRATSKLRGGKRGGDFQAACCSSRTPFSLPPAPCPPRRPPFSRPFVVATTHLHFTESTEQRGRCTRLVVQARLGTPRSRPFAPPSFRNNESCLPNRNPPSAVRVHLHFIEKSRPAVHSWQRPGAELFVAGGGGRGVRDPAVARSLRNLPLRPGSPVPPRSGAGGWALVAGRLDLTADSTSLSRGARGGWAHRADRTPQHTPPTATSF